MSSSVSLSLMPARERVHRRSAFNQLVTTEAKLLLREPWLFFWGVLFPVVLTVVFGVAGNKPQKSLGGLTLLDTYVPVMMAFVLTILSVSALPVILATYREKGILRRFSATPMRPAMLLGADLSVIGCTAVVAMAVIVVVAKVGFGAHLPSEVGGFLLSLILSGAATLSLGMLVAAVASSGRMAAAIGTMLFFPMMFFAGLWVPRAQMGAGLRDISNYTPLGAAVAAIQQTMHGSFPSASHLLVLAGYAIVLGLGAIRLFRWE
jgi:ABC-2 type transport system permease protein